MTLVAHKDLIKQYWLKEIRQYASDVVALAEHAADDLQLTEVPEDVKDTNHVKAEPVKVERPKLEESPIQATEKRKEVIKAPEESETKKAKVGEDSLDMSSRYSSSRYSSASSRVIEGDYVDFNLQPSSKR